MWEYARITGKPKKLSNGNTLVETWSGEWELPSDGSIDEDVASAFTTGHCHSFALALNDLTGWKMYASLRTYGDTPDSPGHVFVQHPSGRFVDVRGFMHKNSEGRSWLRGDLIPVSKDDIANFKAYFKARPKFAMPYAKTVLAQLGGLPMGVPAMRQGELFTK